jgi:hypothetical protein
MRKHITITLLALAVTTAGAFAQRRTSVSNIRDSGVPTITDVTPVAGIVNETRIVFTGTATDVAGSTTSATGTARTEAISGIDRVEYRIEGSSRWHRATLTARDATTTTFFFSVNVGKGKTKRVFVRARDRKNNESDTLGRRFKHSNTIFRTATTTTTAS